MEIKVHYCPFSDEKEAEKKMLDLGSSAEGSRWMAKKSQVYALQISKLCLPAINILKQEALSKGADAAVHYDCVVGGGEGTSVLLLATAKQYGEICRGLTRHPFGLQAVGREIEEFLLAVKQDLWQIEYNGGLLELGQSPKVMGILNITPDSFFDGGAYLDRQAALAQARQMIDAGAAMIDIGGASSRPGHDEVSAEEELARVLPVIDSLNGCGVPLSIDSDKPQVTEAALNAGCSFINDIGGLRDAKMRELAAKSGAPVIVMHQGADQEALLDQLDNFFAETLVLADEAGIKREKLIFDPGIGFGKNCEENLTIIKNIGRLKRFGHPVLLAASNKRFIGTVLDKAAAERDNGNAAVTAWAANQGLAMVRVHNVALARDIIKMTQAIKEAQNG